jgi:hypothetical protein
MDIGGITDWKSFIDAGRTYLDANWQSPIFELIKTIDELYRVVYDKVRFPELGVDEQGDFFHMCFLFVPPGIALSRHVYRYR